MTIGVTGGIGSGKSTVAALFGEWGADVIDVDRLGWEVLEDKESEVVKEFGSEIVVSGKIDRKKLGRQIFADPGKREKLDSIIHPPLIRKLRNRIDSINSKWLVVDCALIYEWKIEGWFDRVVLVTSSYDNKIGRLTNSGLTEEEARNRIRSQLPDEAKGPDVVIENDGDLGALRESVRGLWEKIVPS
jgi:dephospho-CoA kinase